MPHLLGVDACPQGWVGIELDVDGRFRSAVIAPTIADLVGAHQVVAIDIPIGLPDAGRRATDAEARRRIGRLASSVFTSPTRVAIEAATYEEAARAQLAAGGPGLSKQTWALRTKLLDVDRWVRQAGMRVVEVHPEVSFALLNGGPLTFSKRSWNGQAHRRALLASAGIELLRDLGDAGAAGADDVLDAAAAAWTALRVAAGQAESLPSPPETFSDGLPAAIWV